MEAAFIVELIRAIYRELIEWRTWLVGCLLVVTFCVLGVGLVWPTSYETRAMLYADVTNIIAPLLKGRAEVTDIDHSEQAREMIYTRKIMQQVATDVGFIDATTSVEEQESRINRLRSNIVIRNEGKNYFRVIYTDTQQDKSFRVLNAVVDAFIAETSDQRRQESRGAYQFIEQQVASYKRQLLTAETSLKEFKSKNLDGDESSVRSRINELRRQIEELKLSIDEIESRDRSLKDQLKNETAYLDNRNKVDEERNRLNALKARLDELRLSYQETYPDIVSLKQQIASQEVVIETMQGGAYMGSGSGSNNIENPLYEELRLRQAESEIDLRSQRKRLEAIERLLKSEYERAERIASKEAELAELVRDYDVTREIYEEMLGRKEKARLSMTLDVEGQGTSFKIQEPSVYPLHPSGARFFHFVLAAPFVGLLVAIGLVVLYVLVDPRVRSASKLMNSLPDDIELLAVVPHARTALGSRLLKTDMIVLIIVCVVAAAAYTGIVWARLSGHI